MKLNILPIALLLSLQAFAQSYKPALAPYVKFLNQQNTTGADYVLELFRKYDLVIICERAHPEITQYDLFLSIIGDPRFINSVGNVFTEIGISTQAEQVNAFLHTEDLPSDSVDKVILGFQRNCSFYPVWESFNYSYFLHGVYNINQGLPQDKKINVFNSDVPFDWNTIDSVKLKAFWDHLADRDSIIASQVIQQFDRIDSSRSKRHKALVVMNYRHAFGHRFESRKGIKPDNVGRYLFDRYGDRVANVYLNAFAIRNVKSDNDMGFAAIQDGKWDAAFKVLAIDDRGFDFKNSPFGRDTFDIWPMKVDFRYEDVFDGFVFYVPLEKQKLVPGVPGLIDSSFSQEIKRRFALFSTLPGGRFKPLTDKDLEGLKQDVNGKRERPMFMLDSLNVEIKKWTQE